MVTGLLRGRKSDSGSLDAAELASTLFVHVGAFGYTLRPPGAPPDGSKDFRGDMTLDEHTGVERIEHAITEAVGTVIERQQSKTQRISVLLDDPQCIFRDNRSPGLVAASQATARELGKQYVGCDAASFGMAPFGVVDAGGRNEGMIYGFIDVELLRRYLAAFQRHALKIIEMVPLPYLFLQRASGNSGGAYGAVYPGVEETVVALANPRVGGVVVRNIPIGQMALIRAVSSAQRTPIKETMQSLAKRGHLDQLAAAMKSGGRPTDANAQAMAPVARRLVGEIESTVDYFEAQCGGGRPKGLEMWTDAPRLQGFNEWLSKATGLVMKPVRGTPFDLLVGQPHPLPMNLLVGSERGLITDGKVSYSFVNKGFAPTESKGGAEQAHVPKALQSRAQQRETMRRARRGRASFGGLFGRGQEKKGESSGGGGGPEKDRRNFTMLAVLLLAIVYLGYSEFETIDRKHTRAVSAYTRALKASDAHLSGEQSASSARAGAPVQVDKVLWTEKFLSLADNMNQHLWFTDVYLVEGAGSGKSREQQLVMEGAALPSTDGHIAEISKYIRSLMDDRGRFMGDFSDIRFGGAQIEGGDVDGIIRFSIVATYERKGATGARSASRKKRN